MEENKNEQAMNPSSYNNEEKNKTNTFNLVIGIATLLIALLGATFAYFSATARSAENDVTVKSAYVSITYEQGTQIKATNLIPSSLDVMLSKYQKDKAEEFIPTEENPRNEDYDTFTGDPDRICVDANGREVCYVYEFSVTSDGSLEDTTEIIASLEINKNEFDNLSYLLYEVKLDENEEGTAKLDKYGIHIVSEYLPLQLSYRTKEIDLYRGSDADNLNPTTTFEVFAKPPQDSDGNSVSTSKPIACLFGYVDNYNDLSDEEKLTTSKACRTLRISNQEKHTYQLVVWLEETGVVQPEQGLSFEGTAVVEVAGNDGISSSEKITGKQ